MPLLRGSLTHANTRTAITWWFLKDVVRFRNYVSCKPLSTIHVNVSFSTNPWPVNTAWCSTRTRRLVDYKSSQKKRIIAATSFLSIALMRPGFVDCQLNSTVFQTQEALDQTKSIRCDWRNIKTKAFCGFWFVFVNNITRSAITPPKMNRFG